MRLVALALMQIAVAIAATDSSQQHTCSFTEEFKPLGWEVPGLTKSKLVRAGEPSLVEGVSDVYADALDPGEARAMLFVLSCDPKHAGRVVVRDQPINVHSITRFRRGQRVFAYRVVADRAEVEGGKWIPVGESEMLVYCDVDGSGKLKLRRWATLFKLEIPEWVRSDSGQ